MAENIIKTMGSKNAVNLMRGGHIFVFFIADSGPLFVFEDRHPGNILGFVLGHTRLGEGHHFFGPSL